MGSVVQCKPLFRRALEPYGLEQRRKSAALGEIETHFGGTSTMAHNCRLVHHAHFLIARPRDFISLMIGPAIKQTVVPDTHPAVTRNLRRFSLRPTVLSLLPFLLNALILLLVPFIYVPSICSLMYHFNIYRFLRACRSSSLSSSADSFLFPWNFHTLTPNPILA